MTQELPFQPLDLPRSVLFTDTGPRKQGDPDTFMGSSLPKLPETVEWLDPGLQTADP